MKTLSLFYNFSFARLPAVLLLLLFISQELSAQGPAAYEKAGDQLMKDKNPVAALEYFLKAYDERKEDVKLHAKIVLAARESFAYREALNYSMKGVKMNDYPYTMNLVHAELLHLNGRHQEALDYLRSLSAYTALPRPQSLDSMIRNMELSAELALRSPVDSLSVFPGPLNSPSSELSPVLVSDSLLLFTSNRPRKTSEQTAVVPYSLYQSNLEAVPLFKVPSSPKSQHNLSSFSLSPDGALMIMSICEGSLAEQGGCALYESIFDGKQWSTPRRLPETVNFNQAVCTQPSLSPDREYGYRILFSSNYASGNGDMNLWQSYRSASGKYSPATSLSDKINSTFDEVTPFYDPQSSTLYFSSNRGGGMGAFDVYSIRLFPDTGVCINAGPVINSPFNEYFFYKSPSGKHDSRRFLASNRPPALRWNEQTCCYDIFEIHSLPPPVEEVRTPTDPVENRGLSEKQKSALNNLLPLRLYFDNDYPDPRSKSDDTKSRIDELLLAYSSREPIYLEGLSRTEPIRAFFRDSITGGVSRLKELSQVLSEILAENHQLDLTIRASASPLAKTDYNEILSRRRIKSLLNYWNAEFAEHLHENPNLRLIYEPKGESAFSKVSDLLEKPRESVYSLEAVMERYIEITGVEISRP